MKQFLYQLKLRDNLLEEANWTQKENEVVKQHFLRLQRDTENKKVIFAGRTLNTDSSSFGIVVFLAESEHSANEYMNKDPAIIAGIMKGFLFPFRVALIQPNFEVK